jgi:hypothetical protein
MVHLALEILLQLSIAGFFRLITSHQSRRFVGTAASGLFLSVEIVHLTDVVIVDVIDICPLAGIFFVFIAESITIEPFERLITR